MRIDGGATCSWFGIIGHDSDVLLRDVASRATFDELYTITSDALIFEKLRIILFSIQ